MKLEPFINILFIGVVLVSSCSDETEIIPKEQELNGIWDLKNLSGGFAGINEDYADGEITWTFNPKNQTIIIDNNQPASESFIFKSGAYSYSVTVVNNQKYLNINSSEYGGISITNNSLIIDQNNISDGIGADGFILHFEK